MARPCATNAGGTNTATGESVDRHGNTSNRDRRGQDDRSGQLKIPHGDLPFVFA
jgi:hypothetical protein